MKAKQHRTVAAWLLTGCTLIYLMVVIGGITRLTRSGLSMVEWSPTGALPPMNEMEWQAQFDKYRTSPEYQLVNTDFTLADFKKIFWWEYIHRFIGRSIGVVFIVPFAWFLFRRKIPAGFMKKTGVLLLLGALQGLAGWYMVKSGLIKDPHVSHYRLAIHLLLAFTTFGFTFWYALDLLCPEREWGASVKVRNWARALLAATVVQIIYGAFVAGLKAGYLYPTFPKMGTEWMPAEVTSLEPAWKNFTEGHAGVQFAHRYIACVVVLLTILVFYHSRKAAASATQKRVAIWLLVLTGAQFTLGVCTLVFNMPIAIAALHQTGAFFLFAALLYMLHRSRT